MIFTIFKRLDPGASFFGKISKSPFQFTPSLQKNRKVSKLISVPYELHVAVHVFLRIQLDNHFNDTCLIQFDFAPEKAETVYEYSSFVGFFFISGGGVGSSWMIKIIIIHQTYTT